MFNDQEREVISGALNFGIPAGALGPNQSAPPPRLQQPGQQQSVPQPIPPPQK
jgi:hypothetical protein